MYNEDLNTTMIFVRFRALLLAPWFDPILSPVCSLQSVPHSSLTSSQSLSQTPVNGRRRTSGRSSASIDPLLQTKTLPLPRRRTVLLWGLFQPRTSYMRVNDVVFGHIRCDVG